jgi:hypothetical protein
MVASRLLVAFLIAALGGCDFILGLDSPRAAADAMSADAPAIDAAAEADAASEIDAPVDDIDATAAPDATSMADATVDAAPPDATVDARPPPPDAGVDASPPDAQPPPDACFGGNVCSGNAIIDECTGAIVQNCSRGCCDNGTGPFCLPPREIDCGIIP